MDKKLINELASELYISLTPEEEQEFLKEFDYFLKQAALLADIENIDETKPLVFPLNVERTYLREDEPEETLPVNEILSNSKNAKDGFVVIPKVVK